MEIPESSDMETQLGTDGPDMTHDHGPYAEIVFLLR
jgi:hypothetical protein